MNRNTFIMSMVAVLALLGIGYYIFSNNNSDVVNNPKIENSGTSTSAETFKTYRNDRYGISFSYPARYVVEENMVNEAERYHYQVVLVENTQTYQDIKAGKIEPTEYPPSITFDIFQNNLGQQSVEGWIKNTSDSNFKLSTGETASTTVTGRPALEYVWDGLYRGNSIVFAHGDTIIMITATYLDANDDIVRDFRELLTSVVLLLPENGVE